METTVIRFRGVGDIYFIKLGPIEHALPPERTFQGGDEVEVGLTLRPDRPGFVDLIFPDGEPAYEVPSSYFAVVGARA